MTLVRKILIVPETILVYYKNIAGEETSIEAG